MGEALRPVAGEAKTRLKSASLLVGAGDWPSHQQVWAGYKYKGLAAQLPSRKDVQFGHLLILPS